MSVDPRLAGWVTQTNETISQDDQKFGKREKRAKVKIERGKHKILRILKAPSWNKFYIVRAQHWNIPVGMNSMLPLACSYRHNQENCYFCQMTNEYFNSQDPSQMAIARNIKCKMTYICNAIDIKDPVDENGNPKILLWYMTPSVFKDIKETFNPDSGYGDITHPLEGRDVKVKLEVTGSEDGRTYTKYVVSVGGSPKPLVDPPGLDYIDHLVDLEAEFPITTYDYDTQIGIFEGRLDPTTGKQRVALGGAPERKSLASGDDEFESIKEVKKEEPKVEAKSSDEEDDWDSLDDDFSSDGDGDENDSMKSIREKLKKAKQGS